MCLNKDEDEKAVEAPTFPSGWKFVFQCDMQNKPILVIRASNGRQYYSVERARNQNHKALKDVDAAIFNNYVGLGLGDPVDASNFAKEPEQPCDSDTSSVAGGASLPTPEACGQCKRCQLSICGECHACTEEKGELCFHKVNTSAKIS